MFVEDVRAPQDIVLTSTVKVRADENGKATLTIPKELRLSQELLNLFQQSIQAQGLELIHIEVAQEHIPELKELANVVLQENPEGTTE